MQEVQFRSVRYGTHGPTVSVFGDPDLVTRSRPKHAAARKNRGTSGAIALAVSEIGRAVLEMRRLIHLAVVAGAVIAVHNFGPAELQVPVDQYVVRPVLRTSAYIQSELASGVALVSALKTRLSGGAAHQTE